MKAYLKTWRYNIEATNVYHGHDMYVDTTHDYLLVHGPVLDSGRGNSTIVTIVAGDELTIEHCEQGCVCGEEQDPNPPF